MENFLIALCAALWIAAGRLLWSNLRLRALIDGEDDQVFRAFDGRAEFSAIRAAIAMHVLVIFLWPLLITACWVSSLKAD